MGDTLVEEDEEEGDTDDTVDLANGATDAGGEGIGLAAVAAVQVRVKDRGLGLAA